MNINRAKQTKAGSEMRQEPETQTALVRNPSIRFSIRLSWFETLEMRENNLIFKTGVYPEEWRIIRYN